MNDLIDTVISGNCEKVEAILKETDYSAKYNFLLWLASCHGHCSIFKMLLKKSKTINLSSLLNESCSRGHYEIIELLLSLHYHEPFAVENVNDYCINIAAAEGHYNIVELLLKDSRVDPEGAIIHAAAGKHYNIVELLLKDSRVDPTIDNNSAFYHAVYNNSYDIVELLLKDSRINPHHYSSSRLGCYPIVCAASNGDVKMMKILLKDSRVDPSCIDNLPLRKAAENLHFQAVKLLLYDPRVDSNSVFLKSVRDYRLQDVFKFCKKIKSSERPKKLKQYFRMEKLRNEII